MKKYTSHIPRPSTACLLAFGLFFAVSGGRAQPILNFPFNEGSGLTTTDSANGLVGELGNQQDPLVDYVQLIDASPSGLPGDRCITNSGNGFLVASDAPSPVLDITNGPITMETWIFIDPFTPAKSAEGIMSYGFSYKMGMKGGWQVFTLYGIADITNSAAGPVTVGQWVHLAAAWEPGVGVHFFVDSTEYFVPSTYLAARPVQHNYLTLAAENLSTTSVAAFDRMRIHHAVVTNLADLDTIAATPRAPLPETLVAYNFDEAAFPCTNSVAPAMPTALSSDFLPALTAPAWTNDTPTGLAGDYALAFVKDKPVIFESVLALDPSGVIDLDANGTNYTLQAWVKLPTGPMEQRRVIYFTGGPAPRVSLSINANRALHSTLYGNTDFASSVFVPNDARWHHVAAVMVNFSQLNFYLDGVLRQTMIRTATGKPSSSALAAITIGKENETLYFRGLLDRVQVHNVALSGAELDYPAIPGLPTFDSLAAQPADVAADLGTTVVFTAAPTSASPATYQWRYRTNLADAASVALPGETSLTLTLNNITAQNLGYYFLAVTNTAGAAESYAAHLSLPVNLGAKLFDFEPPTYVSGPIKDQDGWFNDFNDDAVRVLTAAEIGNVLSTTGRTPGQTVHGGSQALLVTGPALATTTIRAITGLETEQKVSLDVWARALAAGPNAIGNTFFTAENASGTRAAGVRFGPNLSIDYGLVSGSWVATGRTADPNTWYHLTVRLDYGTRTYDFLVDGEKVNANPIPFWSNQAGMIMDDLNVQPTLQMLGVSISGSTVTVNWEGGQPPYQLQRRNSLSSGDWENVGTPTNATQGTDVLGDGMMFYRVSSN